MLSLNQVASNVVVEAAKLAQANISGMHRKFPQALGDSFESTMATLQKLETHLETAVTARAQLAAQFIAKHGANALP